MSLVQRVATDSTETLTIYPPLEFLGVPSSATIQVQTPAQALPDTGDAATVGSVSASTNAAALAGAGSLSFASDPTCTVGRLYLVTTTTGERFAIEVVKTGTTVVLAQPLPMAVASSSTLAELAITHALTATETSISSEACLARVTATIDGVVRTWDTQFAVVPAVFALSLSQSELTRALPMAMRFRPAHDQTYQESIRAALDYVVIPTLESRGYHVDRIHSPQKIRPVLIAAVQLHLLRNAPVRDEEHIERANAEYTEMVNMVSNSEEFWYTVAVDDIGEPGSAQPWHNSFRMVR